MANICGFGKFTRFSKEQYENAIDRLQDAMKQLEPDGSCCSVCGDTGHQSWECHHNSLYMEQVAWQVHGGFYKCYHCGKVFTDDDEARDHFGKDANDMVDCLRGGVGYEGKEVRKACAM